MLQKDNYFLTKKRVKRKKAAHAVAACMPLFYRSVLTSGYFTFCPAVWIQCTSVNYLVNRVPYLTWSVFQTMSWNTKAGVQESHIFFYSFWSQVHVI